MARQQNMFQRRMIFAGAGVLAVAALVVYFGGYYPPAKEEAFGTIGAAERYRSGQITSADVKLDNPEVQAFLQSETFDRIVRDPAARQAISNEDLRQAILSDKFAESMALAGRYGANLAELRAQAADLGRSAAGLTVSFDAKRFDAMNMDQLKSYVADLRAKAASLESKLTVQSSKLDGALVAFNDKAIELQRQMAGGALDRASLTASMAELRQKSAELSKLAEGTSLRADAMAMDAKMAALQASLNRGDVQASHVDGALVAFTSDAIHMQQIGGAQTAFDAAVNKTFDAAVQFERQLGQGVDRASLASSAAALDRQMAVLQKVQAASLHGAGVGVVDFARQPKFEAMLAKGAEANITKGALLNMKNDLLTLQKLEVKFEASNSLRDAISNIEKSAAVMANQLDSKAQAADLARTAQQINAQAVALDKLTAQINSAAQLNKLGMTANDMIALKGLAQQNAIQLAVAQHDAFVQGGRAE